MDVKGLLTLSRIPRNLLLSYFWASFSGDFCSCGSTDSYNLRQVHFPVIFCRVLVSELVLFRGVLFLSARGVFLLYETSVTG